RDPGAVRRQGGDDGAARGRRGGAGARRDVPGGGRRRCPAAERVRGAGRGLGDRQNVELFERVAARLGAALASSRPLVDAGWMPHARQVGQSGTTVKPSVYVAFGISGAVQHLAGMKAARTIIAVNTDPQAPIFGVAHYGTTLDAL